MRRSTKSWFLVFFGAALMLLAVSLGQRRGALEPHKRLENWEIIDLMIHLKRSGLSLRLISVSKQGHIDSCAFLTTTDKDWEDLNTLIRDPQHLADWKGTLFCERVRGYDPVDLLQQWGENSLWVGPFAFYGDGELLARVREALNQPA